MCNHQCYEFRFGVNGVGGGCRYWPFATSWYQFGFNFRQPLKSSYGFGKTIQFSCRLGYVLEDPQMSALTCADDGQWDEQEIPVCEPIRCSDVQVPKHGTVSGTSSILDSRITFSCQEGYQLNGEEQITCRPDGTWSHPAQSVWLVRVAILRISTMDLPSSEAQESVIRFPTPIRPDIAFLVRKWNEINYSNFKLL
jgi:CUB/sushi domain-containing protein